MRTVVKLKSSRFKTLLPLGLFGLLLAGGFYFWYKLGDNRGYAPDQPIPFNHEKHASQFKIDCQYCHAAADRSRHATVPSMQVCMNCHAIIRPDSPHIQKMKTLVEQGDSFAWVKVHDLPDFVFFSHQRHIAKGIACERCHGEVRRMQKIRQVETLNMGFCVECHRKEKAPTSCDTCHH